MLVSNGPNGYHLSGGGQTSRTMYLTPRSGHPMRSICRREWIKAVAIVGLSLSTIALARTVLAANHLYECNHCHQQWQGASSPPPFVKCPAKPGQNHWWIKKS